MYSQQNPPQYLSLSEDTTSKHADKLLNNKDRSVPQELAQTTLLDESPTDARSLRIDCTTLPHTSSNNVTPKGNFNRKARPKVHKELSVQASHTRSPRPFIVKSTQSVTHMNFTFENPVNELIDITKWYAKPDRYILKFMFRLSNTGPTGRLTTAADLFV